MNLYYYTKESDNMINPALYSSQSGNWDTPQDFFDKLDEEFIFTLDVCADNNNHKCPVYYTERDDGLQQVWAGTVWCNPPYGRKIIHWMKKAYESSLLGTTVVCLVPSRTDTQWFHKWVYGKAEIRFVEGRLKFGGNKNSAPFPSMVVIYRGVNIVMTKAESGEPYV